jgi:hypothetical protein
MQGGRKLSQWNIFVKKIYQEGHSKNKDYSFKQALTDASKRKSEMGSSTAMGTKKIKKSKRNRSISLAGGKSRRGPMSLAGGKSRRGPMSLAGGKSRRHSMSLA